MSRLLGKVSHNTPPDWRLEESCLQWTCWSTHKTLTSIYIVNSSTSTNLSEVEINEPVTLQQRLNWKSHTFVTNMHMAVSWNSTGDGKKTSYLCIGRCRDSCVLMVFLEQDNVSGPNSYCHLHSTSGPAPPVRLVRFQPDHFSGQSMYRRKRDHRCTSTENYSSLSSSTGKKIVAV